MEPLKQLMHILNMMLNLLPNNKAARPLRKGGLITKLNGAINVGPKSGRSSASHGTHRRPCLEHWPPSHIHDLPGSQLPHGEIRIELALDPLQQVLQMERSLR